MRETPRISSPSRITLHSRWSVAANEDSLSAAAWGRLPSYLTRYAQTLGVTVFAVGGNSDHAHMLFDLPSGKSLDSVTNELQKAVARFLRDSMKLANFAWDSKTSFAESVGRAEEDTLRQYILENAAHHAAGTTVPTWEADVTDEAEEQDAMPSWLRDAMPASED